MRIIHQRNKTQHNDTSNLMSLPYIHIFFCVSLHIHTNTSCCLKRKGGVGLPGSSNPDMKEWLHGELFLDKNKWKPSTWRRIKIKRLKVSQALHNITGSQQTTFWDLLHLYLYCISHSTVRRCQGTFSVNTDSEGLPSHIKAGGNWVTQSLTFHTMLIASA